MTSARLLVLACMALCAPPLASASGGTTVPIASAFRTEQAAAPRPAAPRLPDKYIRALRIEEDISVDGSLREPAWARARPVSDFRQREPSEGAVPTESTRVRVLYDDDRLYIGFTLDDSEPDKILSTDQRRDSLMRGDDTIAVVLDTFHDHRNAFQFQTNPLGTKLDSLLRNEGDVNREWDESWQSAARITEHGWEAELASPSSTRGTPLALLFFSRRIGLDSRNEPIPIDGGVKLTGKIGGLAVGALNASTGNPSGRRAENFSVIRLQHDVLARSRIGLLVTNRTGGDTVAVTSSGTTTGLAGSLARGPAGSVRSSCSGTWNTSPI